MARESSVLVRLRLLGQGAFTHGTHAASAGLRDIGSAGSAASAGLGRATAALTAVASVMGGAAIATGTRYNATLDSQRIAFTAMTGSAEKAREIMARVQKLAERSPTLDPTSAGQAVQRMLAYGLSVDRAFTATERIGDSAAAAGKSVEEAMGPAALAIGQIQSKGKLSAEELNQLAESVAVGRGSVAKALGQTGAEFEKSLESGAIGATEGLNAIFKAMQERSGGAAKAMAQTTAGRFDRFKELIANRVAAFQRPFYDAAGEALGGIISRFEDFDAAALGRKLFGALAKLPSIFTALSQGARGEDRGMLTGVAGMAAKVGTIIGQVARGIKTVVSDVLEAIRPAQPFLQNVLLPLLKGIAIGVIGGVVLAFRLAIPLIRVVATVLGWLGQKLAPLKGLFQTVGMIIGIVFGPGILGRAASLLGRLASFLGGPLGVALQVAQRGLMLLRVPFQIVTGAARIWIGVITRVVGAVGRAVTAVGRFAGTLTGAARRAILGVTNALQSIIGKLSGFAGRIKDAAGKIGRGIVQGIVDAIKRAPGAIVDAIGSIIPDKLKSAVGDVAGFVTGRAAGGTVRRGEMTVVGERGPELARFPAGTRITPAAQTAQVLGRAPRDTPSMARSVVPIVIPLTATLDGGVIHRSVVRHEQALEDRL